MDYWQDKIDTSDIKLFNMEWTIFSASDVRDMFESAKRYGLFPCGDIQSTCKARCIDYAGRQYTFGWFALEKRA